MYIIEACWKLNGELIIRYTADTIEEAQYHLSKLEIMVDADIYIAKIIEHSEYIGVK